ncbi:hypothetical protein Trydic_g15173 [Trypoxylus dichotomus]
MYRVAVNVNDLSSLSPCVPRKLINLVKATMNKLKAKVKIQHVLSDTFDVEQELRQAELPYETGYEDAQGPGARTTYRGMPTSYLVWGLESSRQIQIVLVTKVKGQWAVIPLEKKIQHMDTNVSSL